MLFLLLLLSFKCIFARGPPSLLPEASKLTTLTVNENDPIELHCPVAKASDLSVQWLKNNEELDPMWSTSNLIIKRFQLKIPHAQINDAGLYKCNVVNGFGHVHALFQINLQSNQTKTNQHTELINEDLDLLDNTDGGGGGEAPAFISRTDLGQTGPTRVIQPEGTAAQFKCLVTGKPTPEIRWKKNGKVLSEDEYGLTQSQILNIKDLRQTDTGNYTCEVSNAFGKLNATYILIVTEKLQFFGNDPQNTTVDLGKTAIFHCRVRTDDPNTKIQWLKKLDNQQIFRPEAVLFDSEQYELIEQTNNQHVQYFDRILSKPLIFSRTTMKETGIYVCLIQREKLMNYKKAFLNVIETNGVDRNNMLIYVISIPLVILGLFFLLICCLRSRHQHQLARNTDTLKSSQRPRQALIPSTSSGVSNDYLTTSVDSIPITRQYQSQRYGPSTTSDLASLASSNLYYARVQAL